MLEGKSNAEKLQYLYDTYEAGMYAIANEILKDSHLAEDVVQEVMLRITKEDVMEKISTMDESALKSYLFIIAKRFAINFYQKRKREAGVTIGEYNEEVINNIPIEDCANTVLRKMEEEEVFNMVNGIPKKYADVLIYKYKLGVADKDIAKLLNITEATVRKRLERARKKLLESLQKQHYLKGNSYEE